MVQGHWVLGCKYPVPWTKGLASQALPLNLPTRSEVQGAPISQMGKLRLRAQKRISLAARRGPALRGAGAWDPTPGLGRPAPGTYCLGSRGRCRLSWGWGRSRTG